MQSNLLAAAHAIRAEPLLGKRAADILAQARKRHGYNDVPQVNSSARLLPRALIRLGAVAQLGSNGGSAAVPRNAAAGSLNRSVQSAAKHHCSLTDTKRWQEALRLAIAHERVEVLAPLASLFDG